MSPIGWTESQLLAATGARRICGTGACSFSGISIDSRTVAPGDLFVAIRGERHDGHQFVAEVRQKGVSGFVIAEKMIPRTPVRQWAETGVFCAAVPDTTAALAALASFNRARAGIRVIAVTGSNGKTTTRAMTAAVMARCRRVLATMGNLNNEIGLPLTLFRLEPSHEWAVLEMGMNHAGEIRRLARICRPDVGIITNIGPAHLKDLGSMEGVAAAKGELLDEMGTGATAILNADDPRCLRLAENRPFRVVRFGLDQPADISAHSLETTAAGVSFVLRLPGAEAPVRLRVPGRFMVMNALAAAAAGWVGGIPPEEIARGIEGFQPVAGRMGVIETRKRITFVNDTYNANPHSMRAAFDAFAAMRGGRRGILVLGDMFELGESAESLHRSVGEWAAESGVSRLCATGEFASAYLDGALKKGIRTSDMVSGAKALLVEDLKRFLAEGDWVLVKGSRGMAMETVLNDLRNWADA
ncbi:UDP-N-acetylmuramoyl-tripeptide--D-alanyl-D-alanine ligase [Desulfococcus sp.]|uniref:UDP-N-acetylmuramoyl-tripeptide--D-alanyl-D- alanine ligase n=1 Tax=Desulfococcus sp. TaxID=2025834 RepID=UPI003593B6BE